MWYVLFPLCRILFIFLEKNTKENCDQLLYFFSSTISITYSVSLYCCRFHHQFIDTITGLLIMLLTDGQIVEYDLIILNELFFFSFLMPLYLIYLVACDYSMLFYSFFFSWLPPEGQRKACVYIVSMRRYRTARVSVILFNYKYHKCYVRLVLVRPSCSIRIAELVTSLPNH